MRVESHEGWDDNFEADTGTGQVDIPFLSPSTTTPYLLSLLRTNKYMSLCPIECVKQNKERR